MPRRSGYPSDVTDEEWHFIAPYLTLIPFDAPQRKHDPRAVLNALRWVVRTGAQWAFLPNDFPPAEIVREQARRWIEAGCFENIVHDLRELLRLREGRKAQPSAVVLDSRTMKSTPESGSRAAYNGHKGTKGSKVHAVVDTLGQLLTLTVTPANVDDRRAVLELCQATQELTGEAVTAAFVDQGYSGEQVRDDAELWGIDLLVVQKPGTSRGFLLVPRRWVVERFFALTSRFRRLAKDFERLPEVLAGMHYLAYGILLLAKFTREVGTPST